MQRRNHYKFAKGLIWSLTTCLVSLSLSQRVYLWWCLSLLLLKTLLVLLCLFFREKDLMMDATIFVQKKLACTTLISYGWKDWWLVSHRCISNCCHDTRCGIRQYCHQTFYCKIELILQNHCFVRIELIATYYIPLQ